MMAVIIFLAAVLGMILLSLYHPVVHIGRMSISAFWLPPFFGSLLLILTGTVSFPALLSALTASDGMNPLKILCLFLSMTAMSVVLDELGLFSYLASKILRIAGNHQMRLFVALYALVSVLTVFTSNDIIILTFTPFIIYFAKNAGIDPVPYLFAEFTAANTWSMFLIIGNPTNIYLSATLGIGFLGYLRRMALPTLAAGLIAFFVLFLLFRRRLRSPICAKSPKSPIHFPFLLVFGTVLLALTTLALAVSSYLPFAEMWQISLCGALLLLSSLLAVTVKKRKTVLFVRSMLRIPWMLVPFLLSMFTLVFALSQGSTLTAMGAWFRRFPEACYGFFSVIAANLLNNIPMSVLFGSILSAAPAGETACYATIIGSNLGALFTPLGALAGIMWSGMLEKYGIRLGFLRFCKYGFLVATPALLGALLMLMI